MYGAILGDIIGSPYEFNYNNIKTKNFPLLCGRSQFTDDSVMTIAIMEAVMNCKGDVYALCDEATISMQKWGNKYPHAGYGVRFSRWLRADHPHPYNSWGNGSAMRVSPVSWAFDDMESVRKAARAVTIVTHDHDEGIKGAEATAAAIFMARKGATKAEIKEYIEKEFEYDLDRTCDEIRPTYQHDESCMKTVPEAIIAFLEGMSFEDVIRNAVSLGGDSDTLTAIAASIAEAFYGVETDLKKAALSRLTPELAHVVRQFEIEYGSFPQFEIDRVHEAIILAEELHRGQLRKGTQTAYITHPMEVYQILTTMNAGDDLLIAGLLHDAVEDTDFTLEEVEKLFGQRAAYLVNSHTEDTTKSWSERKAATLEMLKTAERDVVKLIMADKLSNLRSMLSDYAKIGEKLWERFSSSKEKQSKYNSDLIDVLAFYQLDDDTSHVYWEINSIYKDLFVEFRYDKENDRLFQIPCGMKALEMKVMYGEPVWWDTEEVPECAERIPRLLAERIEELWY